MENEKSESGDKSPHSKTFYTIRLRGPWHVEPLARCIRAANSTSSETNEALPPATRRTMPSDWGTALGEGFRGRVRFRRSFGRPTELEPDQTVWLVIDAVRSRATVSLAGESLGTIGGTPARFDVTTRLDERNELIIDVQHTPSDSPNGPGGLIGEVRLEIEEVDE